jgi:hypothetical protein
VENGKPKLIRKRVEFNDLVKNVVFEVPAEIKSQT